MKTPSASTSPLELFDAHYGELLGPRWEPLKAALREPDVKLELFNPWAPNLSSDLGRPLLDHYLLDPASLWPAKALEVQPREQVVDLCAAPGGKSLALLFDLVERFGLSAVVDFHLLCSDQSLARIKRLKSVLSAYLPAEVLNRVEVFHRDASRWGLYESNVYDRVLVDAPCSGERHLLQQPRELKKWSKARSRHLVNRQMALLCSALKILKPGGRLVYSTCTVSPLENDRLIEQFQKKRAGQFKVLKDFPRPEGGEDSTWGHQIWPDRAQGAGPIYYCVMEKEAEEIGGSE